MFNLEGKIALVAGGAGYLCFPACHALVDHGAGIMVADRNTSGVEELVADLRSAHPESIISGCTLEVGDENSIRHCVAKTVERMGRLDFLVNGTYQSVGKPVHELSGDEFDASLHVNITGAFLLAREAASVMSTGGSIIFFSSMYARIAPDPRNYPKPLNPNPIEYGVSKAAIEQMVRYLSVFWAPRKIRVNAIAPGPFPHPTQRSEFPHWMELLVEQVPMRRLGNQNEIAGAVVFLASNASSYITGQTLRIDGGWTVW